MMSIDPEEVLQLRQRLADCGEVLGAVCVAATLRPNESLVTPIDHAALDAVRAVLADRDNWHSQHQDEETWRRDAEIERDSLREAVAEQHSELVAMETWLRKMALCTYDAEYRAYCAALVKLTELRTCPVT